MDNFSTMWGDMGAIAAPTPKEEKEEKVIDPKDGDDPVDPKEETDPENPKKGDDPEKEGGDGDDPKPSEKPKGYDKPAAEEETSDIADVLGDLEDALVLDDLMLLPEDSQYDGDAKGFAKMMKDNIQAHVDKAKEKFEAEKQELIAKYESRDNPKFADLDPSNEQHAIHMLTEFYKDQDMTDEEIKEEIKDLKELDDLERKAKIAQRKLVKVEKKLEEDKAAEEARAATKRQEDLDKYIDGVKKQIDDLDELSGFKLDAKRKKEFKNYLFKVVDEKTGKTQAQLDAADPQTVLRQAFMGFVDFRRDDFAREAKSDVANEQHKKASRFTSKASKPKGKVVAVKEDEEEKPFTKGFLNGGFFGAGASD